MTTKAIEAGARAKSIVTDAVLRAAMLAENAECDPDCAHPTPKSMRAALEACIEAARASGELVPASAVAAERERCAKVAEREAAIRGIEWWTAACVSAAYSIRALSPEPASGEFVVVPLTRTQFIVQMVLCYANLYPKTETRELMNMAADTYRDFITCENIEFGDPRYDWSKSGARTIVCEYENAAMLNAATKDGGGAK